MGKDRDNITENTLVSNPWFRNAFPLWKEQIGWIYLVTEQLDLGKGPLHGMLASIVIILRHGIHMNPQWNALDAFDARKVRRETVEPNHQLGTCLSVPFERDPIECLWLNFHHPAWRCLLYKWFEGGAGEERVKEGQLRFVSSFLWCMRTVLSAWMPCCSCCSSCQMTSILFFTSIAPSLFISPSSYHHRKESNRLVHSFPVILYCSWPVLTVHSSTC